MGRRIRWLGLVLLLCFAVLMIQLTNVQFRRASALANSRQNPRVIAASHNNARGDILAADGTVLATSTKLPSSSVYHYQRSYPLGPLFSEVVGFDSFNYGLVGVEDTYNQYLIPHKQPAQSIAQLFSPQTSTDRVTLTLQPYLQQVAATALANRDGAVVALNPTTGAIEALYSNPTYDPNQLVSPYTAVESRAWAAFNQKDAEGFAPLSNMAVDQIFPPGSTFKVITSSAAYDHAPQLVGKQYPPVGCITFPDSTQQLCNEAPAAAPCGGDIATMLPPSCDTGFASLGVDIGGDSMAAEANSFGYNSAPPLDFTTVGGVARSHFPPGNELGLGHGPYGQAGLAYSSIGQQDVSASALQGAMEAAAIANGGAIMTPHVLADVHDAQGNLVTSYHPSVWRQATSAATAAALNPIMQAVVTQPGATAAAVGFLPQDQVAAKTGTAQSGANNQFNTDWMVAFAPASAPKVAVAVVLPEQQTGTTGAECSGPVMNDMIQAALHATPISQLPPSTAGCPQVAP